MSHIPAETFRRARWNNAEIVVDNFMHLLILYLILKLTLYRTFLGLIDFGNWILDLSDFALQQTIVTMRQIEVRENKTRTNLWKCPPQPHSGALVLSHWRGMRGKDYSLPYSGEWVTSMSIVQRVTTSPAFFYASKLLYSVSIVFNAVNSWPWCNTQSVKLVLHGDRREITGLYTRVNCHIARDRRSKVSSIWEPLHFAWMKLGGLHRSRS